MPRCRSVDLQQIGRALRAAERVRELLPRTGSRRRLGLGGHSSGDVFATGADMVGTQKTNSISIDQIAANAYGHQTRFASMVLGTEGGTGSYGRSKTLSHRGPGRPIPSMHKPQEIFNRLLNPTPAKASNRCVPGSSARPAFWIC